MQLQYSTVALPHGIDTSLYYSIIYKCVGAEVLILRLIYSFEVAAPKL